MYDKCLQVMLQRMDHMMCSGGCTKNAISYPKIAVFFCFFFFFGSHIWVGLAWDTIGIYRSAIYAF